MSDEIKEESNSTPTSVKDDSSKAEVKTADESSKESDKESVKDESAKEDSVKSESGKENSDDDDDEEMALLDRPVEVTGCRARKKVERLEVSFATPKEKEKAEIPEGKGQKLGTCPRIEYQIQKHKLADLKTLHKILFNRLGAEREIKKNIRKFSGFTFDKSSQEFLKKKSMAEKLTITVLKQVCDILDIEHKGTKDDLVTRILEFLLEPKDSGKEVKIKKKTPSKNKKKSADKKVQKKLKSKKTSSGDEVESLNDSADDASEESEKDIKNEDEEMSDEEPKKKSKSVAKTPAPKNKTKKAPEKPKKEEKKTPKSTKRKREEDSDSSDSDKPIAKKNKMPSDEEIKKLVKRILDSANLQEITMKKVIEQVSDAYPDFDLSHKKAFIKTTIKSLLNL